MSSSKIDTSSEKMSLSLQLEERSRRWTWAANAALGPIEVHMVVVAQDLGRFDIELLELDNRIGIEGLLTAFQENTRRFRAIPVVGVRRV